MLLLIFIPLLLPFVAPLNFSIASGASFVTTLNYNPPAYFFELLPPPSSSFLASDPFHAAQFCRISKPKYTFTLYSNDFDQTDPSIFYNQSYFLNSDNYLFFLLKDKKIFQHFSLTINPDIGDEAVNLLHLNERIVEDSDLLEALSGEEYLQLFFLEERKEIAILTKNFIFYYQVDTSNKKEWLNFRKFKFLSNTNRVLYAKLIETELVILRQDNKLEIWNVDDKNRTDPQLIVQYDFRTDFYFLKFRTPSVIDFEMDSNYFGFIDSSTNRFHWFKYDSNYKMINTTTPLTLLLTNTPLRIDFPSSSLFILTQPPASTGSSDLWLTQYDLSLEQLRVFSVPKDFLDLEVMQNYLILTTNDKIALVPHEFQGIMEINNFLTENIPIKNIEKVIPFSMSRSWKQSTQSIFKYENYFLTLRANFLQFAMIDFSKPQLICNASGVKSNNYELNYKIYQANNCIDIDFSCNVSSFRTIEENYGIEVLNNNDQINEAAFKGGKGENLDLILGLCLGFGGGSILILAFACCCFARLKGKYREMQEKKVSIPQSYGTHLRIGSTDELKMDDGGSKEEIGTVHNDENKI